MNNADILISIGGPLVLLFMAAGLGGLLAGWTGWGGWIVTGAVAWMLFPPLVALVAAQPFIFATDAVLAKNGKIRWDVVRKVMPWAIPGVFLGAFLVLALPERVLLLFAGVVLLLAVFPQLWKGSVPMAPASILGGIWTTTGGWNSPPFALALFGLNVEERRGTLGMIFLILSLLALPALLLAGIDSYSLGRGLVLGAILLLPALLGTLLGLGIRQGEVVFIRLGQAVSLLGAIALIVRAL